MRLKLIIPARYQSRRLPGKPLVMLHGKSMIRRCWERCANAFPAQDIWVATDDARILAHCQSAGIQVLMTPEHCLTGTDRVALAAREIPADYYLSVQGDEPLIDPSDILAVRDAALSRPDWILNGMCHIEDERDYWSLKIPKVVCRQDGRLLYMSRRPIPGGKTSTMTASSRQVCIYGLPPVALEAFIEAGVKTPLESIEDIEILRFLELGHEVRMIELSAGPFSVDIPEDVPEVERIILARGLG